MKEVSMMPVVVMPRIGVHPDGSPVVYDPEKAAAKRAEIVATLREKNNIEEDVVELSSNDNQPKFIAAEKPMMMAKISPVQVIGWIEVIDKGYRTLKPVFVDVYDTLFGGKNAAEESEADDVKPSFEEIA